MQILSAAGLHAVTVHATAYRRARAGHQRAAAVRRAAARAWRLLRAAAGTRRDRGAAGRPALGAGRDDRVAAAPDLARMAAGPAVPRQPAVRRRDHPVPGRRGLAAVGRLRAVAGDRADRGDPGPARAEAARDRPGPGAGRGPGRRDHDDRAARPARRRRAAPRRCTPRSPPPPASPPRSCQGHTAQLAAASETAGRAASGDSTAQARPRVYRVQEDDDLWDIAERFLGDPEEWHQIYQLNEGRPQPDGRSLTDPNLIIPGWVLLIPQPATGHAPAPHPGTRSRAAPGPARPAAAGPRSRPPGPPGQPGRRPSPPGQPGRPHGHPRRPRARGRPPAAARRAAARTRPRSRCGCRPAR